GMLDRLHVAQERGEMRDPRHVRVRELHLAHDRVLECHDYPAAASTSGSPWGRGGGAFAKFETAANSGSKSNCRLPMRQSVRSPARCGYSFTNTRKLNA